MSLHHCGFAGSASLRPSTYVNVVCDLVWSLYQVFLKCSNYFDQTAVTHPGYQPLQSSNFTHFLFLNGHGGNVMPIKLAMEILSTEPVPSWARNLTAATRVHPTQGPGFKVQLVSWYANEASQALARSLYGSELGDHATPDEVIADYIYMFIYNITIGIYLIQP